MDDKNRGTTLLSVEEDQSLADIKEDINNPCGTDSSPPMNEPQQQVSTPVIMKDQRISVLQQLNILDEEEQDGEANLKGPPLVVKGKGDTRTLNVGGALQPMPMQPSGEAKVRSDESKLESSSNTAASTRGIAVANAARSPNPQCLAAIKEDISNPFGGYHSSPQFHTVDKAQDVVSNSGPQLVVKAKGDDALNVGALQPLETSGKAKVILKFTSPSDMAASSREETVAAHDATSPALQQGANVSSRQQYPSPMTTLQRSNQVLSTSMPGAFPAGGGIHHFDDAEEDYEDGHTVQIGATVDEEAQIMPSDSSGGHPPNHAMPVANLIKEDEQPSQALPMASQEERKTEKNKSTLGKLCGMALLLGVVIVVVITATNHGKHDSNDSSNADLNDNNSTNILTVEKPLRMEEHILSLLPEATSNGILVAMNDDELELGGQNFTASTPQQRAFQWVVNDPNITSLSNHRIVQRFALSTFFYATNGPTGWRQRDNWLNYSVHECDWYGAEPTSTTDSPDIFNLILVNDTAEGRSTPCNGESYEFLRLKDNDIEGPLPLELTLLSNLRGISLERNKLLHGTIPSQIGTLSQLEDFIVFAADLIGTIPSEIGSLSNLKLFHAFVNQLTGSIPTEIGLLSNLLAFGPSTNLLTGTVPSEISGLSSLQGFSVHENDITGTIPTEFESLTNLELFFLAYNTINGTVPAGIWKITSLLDIWITMNDITGTVPTKIGQLTNLYTLDIANNYFSGSLPTEIGKMTSMGMLKASKTGLSGNLPTELGLCTKLSFLRMHSNQFDGPLPSQLGELTWLGRVALLKNSFTGTIPTEWGRMSNINQMFRLSGNNLTGSIPSELGLLTTAHTFDLADNHLSGTLPTQLGNLHGIWSLMLHNNQFSGPIPSHLGLLDSNTEPLDLGKMRPNDRNITTINLSNNSMTGSLPMALTELVTLVSLDLSTNSFSGEIPDHFGEFANLKVLNLNGNMFHGTIPDQLGFLASNESLGGVQLEGNPLLSGLVPVGLCHLNESLSFDCGLLCGCDCSCVDESDNTTLNKTSGNTSLSFLH